MPHTFVDKVESTISRFGMAARGDALGVAVSGGADSVCLLRVLHQLSPRWGWQLRVLHLDHGLRGEESDADRRFVEQLAASLSLPCTIEACDLKGPAQRRNLEAAARIARRDFYLRVMREHGLQKVALGHTLSDQAETVLFRLLRGCGPGGLVGILPVTQEGFVRPLIEASRAEVLDWLRSCGQHWREDSSNRSLEFSRNRIRHELLPLLEREWNPRATAALGRLAELAREDENWWDQQIAKLSDKMAWRDGGAVFVKADALASLPLPLARRLIRRLAVAAGGTEHAPGYDWVEAILRLAAKSGGSGSVRCRSVAVTRSLDLLRFAASGEPQVRPAWRGWVGVPGEFVLPSGGRLRVELYRTDCQDPCRTQEQSGYGQRHNQQEESWLFLDPVPERLEVRAWLPGDRYRPAGRPGVEKLKTLFQKARVPSWQRRDWPMLVLDGQVIWAKLFGPVCPAKDWIPGKPLIRVVECE